MHTPDHCVETYRQQVIVPSEKYVSTSVGVTRAVRPYHRRVAAVPPVSGDDASHLMPKWGAAVSAPRVVG